ncbi:hypothetical protein PFNF135_02413, partial [Plasmodium falciparum NF135/5.C10]
IKQKIDTFCNKTSDSSGDCGTNIDSSLCEPWKCYKEDDIEKQGDDDPEYHKEVNGSGGICILEKTNGEENGKKQKTFNDFFNFWVGRFLNDSIEWREKFGKCLKNGTKILCKNGCKTLCKCYESWVEHKQQEWGQIKTHFDKQTLNPEHGGLFKLSPYYVLETVLEDDFLENITKAYGDARAIQGIKKTLEKKKKEEQNADTSKEKTIIDYLLEHEGEDAKQCLQTHKEKCDKPPPVIPAEEGGARSGGPPGGPLPPPGSGPEEQEEEEDEEEEDEVQEEKAEGDQETKVEGPPAQDEVKPPCKIVDDLFQNPEQFKDVACNQKYGYPQRHWGWKCIPSGDSGVTGTRGNDATTKPGADSAPSGKDTGSICVPPRRRKLYIGRLTQWATNMEATEARGSEPQASEAQTQPQDDTHTQPDPLLKAFIESAAVETFFLWDRYKKEWEAQKKAEREQSGLPGVGGVPGVLPGAAGGTSLQLLNGSSLPSESDEDPEKQLKQGTIPDDFLRQMFYTLADYKDILEGKNIVVDMLSASSGSDKEMAKREEKIKDSIQTFFQNGDTQPSSGKPAPKPGGQTPESWWKENAQHIWKGMVCALTYKDNTDSGAKDQPPKHLEDVRKAFFGENNTGKPGTPGTYQSTYKYDKVKLDKDSGTEAKSNESPSPTSDTPTTLDSFIKRPPYFRYLEEWGETFCRQRARMLGKIKYECRTDKVCSGDGEDCNDQLDADPTNVSDLKCPSCATPCRKYRKWIERKKDEFTKQSGAYDGQKTKYEEGSNKDDKGFCETLTTSPTAADFLQKLKKGPCKNDSEEVKKFFDKNGDTFKHAKDCAPCFEFKVKSEKCNCGSSAKGNTCTTGKITAKNFENKTDVNEVVMRVSDNAESGFKGDLKSSCENAHIFEGIKEDKWKCGNFCGYVVCKPEKGNGVTTSGENKDQIITIRGLVAHWVQNFLEDYNKIKHKISHCKENSEQTICKKDCKDKCKCVDEWINKKRTEWQKIRDRFKEQYKDDPDYNVRSVLEEVIPENHLVNVQNKVIKLSKFGNSCGCSAKPSSTNSNEKDAIDCMLKKLEDKAKNCKDQASDTDCTTPPTTLPDDDEPLEEEDQNPENMRPGFCPQLPDPPQEKVEEKCGKDEETRKEKEKKEQEEPAAGGKETLVPGPPAPAPADEPFDPTILQTTIPFGVALALGSIAFLFLKKKTQAPVDLLRVINIPKSDYDIPTKLSPNRYIPYTSGKYRGKRYIYLEGDSGTDSGYTDHYSDITSSSESESSTRT